MNIIEKADFINTIFVGGAKAQLKQEWTWGTAAAIGLHQGLKYNGNLKNGVAGGLAVLIVFAGASGLYNIADNWDKVKKAFKEKED